MLKTSQKLLATALVAMLPLALGACDGGTTGGDSSTISLKLTDAPAGDLEKAWVQIEEIELQGTDSGFMLMDQPTDLVELTSLAGTTEDLVSDVAISSGTYSQLRIVIERAAVQTTDGQVFSVGDAADSLGLTRTGSLRCPSCPQTGIKVNLPGGGITLDGDQKIVLLDFDVSESFGRQAGFSGQWVMHPVIHTSQFEVTGSVAGDVDDSAVSWPSCGGTQTGVADFVPRLEDGEGNVVASGETQSDGSFEIPFVAPDTYTAGYAPELTFGSETLSVTASPSKSSVTVDQNATTSLDYTVDDASCPGSSS